MNVRLKKFLALAHTFKNQINVIRALIFREIHTRYGRENLGFLWIIGEPILFCAGVSIVWTAIRPAREHGLDMTPMVISGYVPLTIFRHCLNRSVHAFQANGSLFYHKQVTPFDVITARSFLEIIGTWMAGVVVTVAAIILGYMKPPVDLGMVLLGLSFQSIFSYAIALIAASVSEISEYFEKCVSIAGYLCLPLTGAFIMINWLPLKYQWILLASPLANNTEMIREGIFGMAAPVKYDLVYNTEATLLTLLLGLYLVSGIRKRLVLNG